MDTTKVLLVSISAVVFLVGTSYYCIWLIIPFQKRWDKKIL